MATITFCPEAEIPALICGESLEKCLQKVPNIRRRGDSGGSIISSITESCADRLVDIEHVLEVWR